MSFGLRSDKETVNFARSLGSTHRPRMAVKQKAKPIRFYNNCRSWTNQAFRILDRRRMPKRKIALTLSQDFRQGKGREVVELGR